MHIYYLALSLHIQIYIYIHTYIHHHALATRSGVPPGPVIPRLVSSSGASDSNLTLSRYYLQLPFFNNVWSPNLGRHFASKTTETGPKGVPLEAILI